MSSSSGSGGVGGSQLPVPVTSDGTGDATVDGSLPSAKPSDNAPKEVRVPTETEDGYALKQTWGRPGPTATLEGMGLLEQELAEEVFVKVGFPNPFNANTTPKLAETLVGTPGCDHAVECVGTAAVNPTEKNCQQALAAVEAIAVERSIIEVLFLVFRESIQDMAEDKRYFLMKLQEFNKMGEQLSDYLHYLVDASQELGRKAAPLKEPHRAMTSSRIETKRFDLNSLDAQGNLVSRTVKSEYLSREGLNHEIKNVESMQETLRNNRQMAQTHFQNFDQKTNQLYNMMASLLRTLGQMREGTTRNLL